MSQVTMTAITTNLPVTVDCTGASLITVMVKLASTTMGQITFDQHDVVLPPQCILRDIFRGSAGLTNMPQQQPQSQMPS